MWQGNVVAIHIAPAADEPMIQLDEATLVAGRGIEGDRYYNNKGTHSDDEQPCYEVTLIESETIEAIVRDKKLNIDTGTSRRNIVTSGFSVNHLVGRTFRIGEATLQGIALCEPCIHLSETSSHSLFVNLIHRGGLGAHIITGGTIRPGDIIEEIHS